MQKTTLIADSGSTKTEWWLNGNTFKTSGINPVTMSEESIRKVLTDELLPNLLRILSDTNLPAPSSTLASSSSSQVSELSSSASTPSSSASSSAASSSVSPVSAPCSSASISPSPSALSPFPLSVHFYGAGCIPEKQPLMRHLLQEAIEQALLSALQFPSSPAATASVPAFSSSSEQSTVPCAFVAGSLLPLSSLSVHSDLLGAARALCGGEPGIACILGTGSNSCLYDGEKVVRNTPALGFVLGDEGSGAVLGRLFLNALLKGRVEPRLFDAFCAFLSGLAGIPSLSSRDQLQPYVIDRVYRQPMPNRFLASLSPFIFQHKDNKSVRNLIARNFSDFFDHNVSPYLSSGFFARNSSALPPAVHAVGSIAYCYQDILREVAAKKGLTIGRVLKSPLQGMAEYHTCR